MLQKELLELGERIGFSQCGHGEGRFLMQSGLPWLSTVSRRDGLQALWASVQVMHEALRRRFQGGADAELLIELVTLLSNLWPVSTRKNKQAAQTYLNRAGSYHAAHLARALWLVAFRCGRLAYTEITEVALQHLAPKRAIRADTLNALVAALDACWAPFSSQALTMLQPGERNCTWVCALIAIYVSGVKWLPTSAGGSSTS